MTSPLHSAHCATHRYGGGPCDCPASNLTDTIKELRERVNLLKRHGHLDDFFHCGTRSMEELLDALDATPCQGEPWIAAQAMEKDLTAEIDSLEAKLAACEKEREEAHRDAVESRRLQIAQARVASVRADELAKAENEIARLVAHIDLMRDEFQRIANCVEFPSEVLGLCARAIAVTHQHVPVIVQRDEAQAEYKRLRFELENIANAKPGEWEPDMRDQFREWAQNRARQALATQTPGKGQ